MKCAIEIDDDLWAKALRLTNVRSTAALIEAGLRAPIERESARRLARLGGSEPRLRKARRRLTLRREQT